MVPAEGEWWLPGSDTRVRGRIALDNDDFPVITLFGELPGVPAHEYLPPSPIKFLNGFLPSYGAVFCADLMGLSNTWSLKGFENYRFGPSFLFGGGPIVSEPFFSSIEIKFDCLSHWLGDEHFEFSVSSDSKELVANYTAPPSQSWPLGKTELTLSQGAEYGCGFGRRFIEIVQKANFKLGFPKCESLSEINYSYLLPLQGFLSYCVGMSPTPNAIWIHTHDNRNELSACCLFGFGSSRTSPRVPDPWGHRVSWQTLVNQDLQPLRVWLEFSPGLRGVADAFFAKTEVKKMFLSQQLQIVIQALEGYCSETNQRKCLVERNTFAEFASEMEKMIASMLPEAEAIVVQKRLNNLNALSLQSKLEELFGRLAPNWATVDLFPDLVKRATKLRHKIAHGDGHSFVPTIEMFQIIDQLTYVLTICLSEAMGFKGQSLIDIAQGEWYRNREIVNSV